MPKETQSSKDIPYFAREFIVLIADDGVTMSISTDWSEQRHHQIKGLVFVLVLLFVMITVIMSLIQKPKKDAPKAALSSSQPAQKTQEPFTNAFNLGITASGANWEYTVNEYRFERVIENQFNRVEAESGKKFLIVSITFNNKTSQPLDMRPGNFDFKVHTPQGEFEECEDSDILNFFEDYYGRMRDIHPSKPVVATTLFEIPFDASKPYFEIGCDNFIYELSPHHEE